MSIKTKIITTMICICCIVGAMVVGILAATQQTFNISGATVSFTSNQIAFDLKYAIMGHVDGEGQVVLPDNYGEPQKITTESTASPWEIGHLNFDGTGSPIYIDITVSKSSVEDISQEVLIKFLESSEILDTISEQNPAIKVSFMEVKQTWREDTTTTPYIDFMDYALVSENQCQIKMEEYKARLGLTELTWETLSNVDGSKNLPKGLVKGEGLDNQTHKTGQYSLIIKIEPNNKGMNFSEVNIDFDLHFSGDNSGSQSQG